MRSRSLIAVGKPLLRRTVRHALVGRLRVRDAPTSGRFTRGDADRLLDDAWERFAVLARDRPAEPTLGARQNVLLACLTLAFLHALVEDGIERRYAIELVGDVAWRVYVRWGSLAKAVTAPLSRDPAVRMRRRVNLFMTYPFSRPGYRFRDREEPKGRALDILRCPVAEYMRANDAADLCVDTWCNLDYPLAEMWGGRLERSGTLAGGAPRCDFRFVADPARKEKTRLRAAPTSSSTRPSAATTSPRRGGVASAARRWAGGERRHGRASAPLPSATGRRSAARGGKDEP